MVGLEVVQQYVMDHHEHLFMVEEFKDVINERRL